MPRPAPGASRRCRSAAQPAKPPADEAGAEPSPTPPAEPPRPTARSSSARSPARRPASGSTPGTSGCRSIELELGPIAVADQRARPARRRGSTPRSCGCRSTATGLHVIPLYDEVAGRRRRRGLAPDGRRRARPRRPRRRGASSCRRTTCSGSTCPARSRHPSRRRTTPSEAIATVAAGVGVVIVPMSLARLHQPQGRRLPAAARRPALHGRARLARRPHDARRRGVRRHRARAHRELVARLTRAARRSGDVADLGLCDIPRGTAPETARPDRAPWISVPPVPGDPPVPALREPFR